MRRKKDRVAERTLKEKYKKRDHERKQTKME